jgi:hypothetical protein
VGGQNEAGLPTEGGFTDRRWALALRVEASFCLDFFVSFCGNDKKKEEHF